MTLSLTAFQVQPTSTLTEPLTLRLWYNQDFIDVDNIPVLAGPKTFYIEFDCSIASSVITVPTKDIYTTLDANVQNPQSINCSAQFFVGNSGKEYLFTQWVIPAEATYPGGSITFAQLAAYNDGSNTLANAPATYMTTAQVAAYFAALDPAPDAATNVKGIGFVSVAPVAAGSPIFLGQNDPAVASSGNVSTANSRITSNSQNISVADSKAVSDSVVISSLTTTTNSQVASASLNISVADSKAISVSLNTSVADSKGVSAGTQASTADSKAVSDSILTSTADSKGVSAGTRASTADSKAVSNSINISTAGSQNTSQSLLISTADSKAVSDSVVTSSLTTTTDSKVASLSLNLSTTTSTANSG